MSGALTGVRVVELGAWVAGPCAGQLMADWGADVIKVEPVGGDPYRRLFQLSAGIELDVNPPFEMDNRGKRSIAVDVAQPEGAALVAGLADRADVFVTNVRAAVLARTGLDYPDLSARNSRLIYARITGYGEDGPDKDRAAYDIGAFWSRAGIAAALTRPGEEPPYQRGGFGDHVTGLSLFSGILGALYARERSDRGQMVSTSLLRAGVFTIGFDLNTVLRLGFTLPQQTRQTMGNVLVTPYRTADDRWFWLLGLESDRHWPNLVAAIERPQWLDDERYAKVAARAAHCEELVGLLDEIFVTRTYDEWIGRFDEAGLWYAPVNTPDQVVADPQVHASGAFVDVPLADGTSALMVSSPVDLSTDRWAPAGPVPEAGQHTDQILDELGLDGAAIAELKTKKIVA